MDGPGRALRKLRFSMRAFATAGGILSGAWPGHRRSGPSRAAGFVDLEIWTASDGAQTAIGTATVWLPSQGAASVTRGPAHKEKAPGAEEEARST